MKRVTSKPRHQPNYSSIMNNGMSYAVKLQLDVVRQIDIVCAD